MRRFFRQSLLMLSVLATTMVLAAPAYAATWTAKIGTTTTGSGTHTMASSGSIRYTDTTTGVVFECTSATAAGSVPHLGSGLSNLAVMTQTSSTYTSCTGAGLTSTLTQVGTWSRNLTGYAAPVSTGYTSGISLRVSWPGCTYTVTGSADLTFNNSTQILTVNPVSGSGHVMTVAGVSGCLGIYRNGDTWTLQGSFHVTAKNAAGTAGALAFTSP